ncbi:CBS domain-containing protein [Actinacidiphila oryziradicis]|uniref:CBS domain-containing protein n=1 Tax=Actinacidiphila oryziradicis TaxID=2571141 RepID=A0A4U0SMM1_9ACTN|nr:CBS domain-containing protein [Actinacidiphila oryziradicis]TKA09451.1 CBS domain-containing protein [Actinacidiphila oryziradicis]
MQHRSIHDVMTRDVIKVRPDAPVKEIAKLFSRNDITAVPVVDEQNRPIGIVSEADLLHKAASLPDPEGRGQARPMHSREWARSEAETAGELMRSPVITARPEWNVIEAARLMDHQKVKRLPVVDEVGRLVGIASRCDLLRIFLRHDTAIREEIQYEVLGRTLSITPDAVQAGVRDGVVTLRGRVGQKSLVPIAVRLCRSVDGVVSVHNELEYVYDDSDSTSEVTQ